MTQMNNVPTWKLFTCILCLSESCLFRGGWTGSAYDYISWTGAISVIAWVIDESVCKTLSESVISKVFVLTWGGSREDGLKAPPLMRGVRHELDDEGWTAGSDGRGHGRSAVPPYFRCIVVVALMHRDVVIGAVVVVVFEVHVQEGQGYPVAWKTVQGDQWWLIG